MAVFITGNLEFSRPKSLAKQLAKTQWQRDGLWDFEHRMKIYKYIGLQTKYGKTNCEELLRSNKIWVSSIQNLNDPFEFEFVRRSLMDTLHLIQYRKNGICSFSFSNDDLLMWSHYGSGHNGLCFEFDSSLDDYLKSCRKVKYLKSLPLRDERDPDQILFSKSKDWAYEKEVRMITQGIIDTHITLDARCLTGIYFGAKVQLEDLRSFNDLCEVRGISRFEAGAVKNDYKLQFKEVSSFNSFTLVQTGLALSRVKRK